jgi:hypothetical protein
MSRLVMALIVLFTLISGLYLVTNYSPSSTQRVAEPVPQAQERQNPGGSSDTPVTIEQARDGLRASSIQQIQLGLAQYHKSTNAYPKTLEALSPDFLPMAQVDPLDESDFLYDQLADGSSYELAANLETSAKYLVSDGNDAVSPGGAITNGADDKSCTGVPGRYCYNVSP